MATFAERFRELRHAAGLTQQALVDDFDARYHYRFSKPAISQYEHGKRVPEVPALIAFADYFGVTVDYLLGLSDQRTYPRTPLTAFLAYLPPHLQAFFTAHPEEHWIEMAREMGDYQLTPRDIADLCRLAAQIKEWHKNK